MKKTLILIAVMLINLITPAYADQAAQVKQRVEFIYNTVFAAYNKAAKEEQTSNKPVPTPNFDSKFCSQEWNKKLSKWEEIQEKTGELIIGADYWVMGQDFSPNLQLKNVKVINVSGNRATVKVFFHNFKDTTATVKLVFERGDWFIDDFDDWKEGLEISIKEYSKSR